MGLFSNFLNRLRGKKPRGADLGRARLLVSGKAVAGLGGGGGGRGGGRFGQGSDDEDDFLYFGKWYAGFSSSNVAMMRFLEEHQTLFVGFNNGAIYGYEPVTVQMAREFFNAASKGTWVWDNLRIRGTQYGHHVNYYYDQGMSTHIPLYRLDRAREIVHDREALEQGGKFTGYFTGTVDTNMGEIILPRE